MMKISQPITVPARFDSSVVILNGSAGGLELKAAQTSSGSKTLILLLNFSASSPAKTRLCSLLSGVRKATRWACKAECKPNAKTQRRKDARLKDFTASARNGLVAPFGPLRPRVFAFLNLVIK